MFREKVTPDHYCPEPSLENILASPGKLLPCIPQNIYSFLIRYLKSNQIWDIIELLLKKYSHYYIILHAAADLSRRGPGLPPWILCPTVICVRHKMDTFLLNKSIFLSLFVSKSISLSLPVYFCPFFSLSFFNFFFFIHFSLFPVIFFLFFFCHLFTPSCVRRQGLPGKARKARQIRPCLHESFFCPIYILLSFYIRLSIAIYSKNIDAMMKKLIQIFCLNALLITSLSLPLCLYL